MILLLFGLVVVALGDSFNITVHLPELQAHNGWVYLNSLSLVPHQARFQLIINV